MVHRNLKYERGLKGHVVSCPVETMVNSATETNLF